MIIKKKGVYNDIFLELLQFLMGDKNVFYVGDINPEDHREIKESGSPVFFSKGEKGLFHPIPRIRAFSRVVSATPKYSGNELYWDVVVLIPDEVKIGVEVEGKLNNDFEVDSPITTNRFLLAIHKILCS